MNFMGQGALGAGHRRGKTGRGQFGWMGWSSSLPEGVNESAGIPATGIIPDKVPLQIP